MSKFTEASTEIQELVNDIANELGLVHLGVDFQPLCINKSKTVCKVVKANELAEYASQREGLIFVLVYEDAFDAITTQTSTEEEREKARETKYMWLRTEMEKVVVDTEKDKISIGCPSITVPVGLCEKFKGTVVEAALRGQHIIAKIEQDKKEEAERKKALRTKGKKSN